MVMTILAKVEVDKSSFQKSNWQFYVRMGLKSSFTVGLDLAFILFKNSQVLVSVKVLKSSKCFGLYLILTFDCITNIKK